MTPLEYAQHCEKIMIRLKAIVDELAIGQNGVAACMSCFSDAVGSMVGGASTHWSDAQRRQLLRALTERIINAANIANKHITKDAPPRVV